MSTTANYRHYDHVLDALQPACFSLQGAVSFSVPPPSSLNDPSRREGWLPSPVEWAACCLGRNGDPGRNARPGCFHDCGSPVNDVVVGFCFLVGFLRGLLTNPGSRLASTVADRTQFSPIKFI